MFWYVPQIQTLLTLLSRKQHSDSVDAENSAPLSGGNFCESENLLLNQNYLKCRTRDQMHAGVTFFTVVYFSPMRHPNRSRVCVLEMIDFNNFLNNMIYPRKLLKKLLRQLFDGVFSTHLQAILFDDNFY